MLGKFDIALFVSTSALELVIAAAILRQRSYGQFKMFFIYTCYAALAELCIVFAAAVSSGWRYFTIYWGIQVIFTILALLAMYESFTTVLQPYSRGQWWLRWQIPALVLLIAVLVTWRSYEHAPVQASPVMVTFISFYLAADYIVAAVYGLFMAHVLYRGTNWRR